MKKILITTSEKYPNNRPMLSELWNKEIPKHNYKLLWIMQSASSLFIPHKKQWGSNTLYILPNFDLKLLNYIINFLGKLILGSYLCIFNKFSYIHIHDGPEDGPIGLINSYLFNIPLIYTYTFPFIDLYKKYKLGKSIWFKGLFYRIRIFFYKTTLVHCDLLFPISSHLRDKLTKDYGIPKRKCLVVSESASQYFLDYKYDFPNNDTKKIIYVGTLARERKMGFLIDAFNIVKKNYKEVNLFILGWADIEKEVLELKYYTERLGLTKDVFFLDKVPYTEVPDIVSRCDIGVSPIMPINILLPSTPTKCIEYMALKLPVVANVENYDQKRIIEQSGGGVLTEYKVDSFADGILYLLKNDEKRKQMRIAGYNWIKSNRTFQITAEKIINKLQDFENNRVEY